MNHEQVVRYLNEYADGTLAPALRAEVEAHLTDCAKCRADAAALRALLADVAALPRSVEPPRDLWAEIDRALDPRGARARTLWSARYWLATAALLLVVGSSTISLVIGGRRTVGDSPAVVLLPAHFSRTETAYLRAVAELEESLDAAKARLAPATVARIERNLAVIDAAIAEIRDALSNDPTNRELHHMLASRYRDKVGLLQHASRLAVGS